MFMPLYRLTRFVTHVDSRVGGTHLDEFLAPRIARIQLDRRKPL